MAFFETGTVRSIERERRDLLLARVEIGDGVIDAVGFASMLGRVVVGNRVVVNTTGIELHLGTGDTGYILWNTDGEHGSSDAAGHIVKLRYTPWQLNVLAAEEPDSPHHETMRDAVSIDGMAVVACGLHSQIAGVSAGIKAALPGARVGYLMSDGGALPLEWSNLVEALRSTGLIDVTCTYGHAFGGDLEAVNVFSGLVALRRAGEIDAAVVSMGPGIVGTATALGFSGIEQGQVLDATTALGGRAIACLRLSFADVRARHHGVSHHTLTALSMAAREPCAVALPLLTSERSELVKGQLRSSGIALRHEVTEADGGPALELLADKDVHPRSMGRGLQESPELWLAAGAAGAVAASDPG